MIRRARVTLASAAGSAYLVLLPVLVVFLAVSGTSNAAPLCAQLPGGAVGGGPGGGPMTGQHTWSAEQTGNAHTITTVTAQRRLPQRAAVIAVATAMQESKLRNLNYGDRDSLGLFQQRPSMGWGTPAQVRDPVYATNTFLDRLITVPNWQRIPLWQAADAVQRSCCPRAYAQWEPDAAMLVGRFWQGPDNPDPVLLPGLDSTASTGVTIAAHCGPGGSGITLAPGIGTQIPEGWSPPEDPRLRTVVTFALNQLGKPYVWGGTGPHGWDCSGLVMRAWAAGGVAIPRVTYDQVHTGTPVPGIAALQPGDLLFIPGSDGTPARPGHVGMALGHGLLVNAPQSGSPVRIESVESWSQQVTSIRRPG
ncbi:lipoprotein [Longimycelium tulufanense]|uniref:Lipoprotein n=1 Tax=Longimycelium tulufanense TaxID=907463 RepID=A0A8J3CD44_9PSEU|nr:C40 family peptidase [Longimycelium tulufanense]GGM76432.1 lipoprotein [Longimycelium tulufanense]